MEAPPKGLYWLQPPAARSVAGTPGKQFGHLHAGGSLVSEVYQRIYICSNCGCQCDMFVFILGRSFLYPSCISLTFSYFCWCEGGIFTCMFQIFHIFWPFILVDYLHQFIKTQKKKKNISYRVLSIPPPRCAWISFLALRCLECGFFFEFKWR